MNILKKLINNILNVIHQFKDEPIIIKLNLKSIIKYEQLTGKSFNEIDQTNQDDMLKLIYCIVLCNNSQLFEYDEFVDILNSKKLSKEIFDKFNRTLKLIEQFKTKDVIDIINNNEITGNTETLFIKDIAATLIVSAGIDAHFVLNEMEIIDVNMYMTAYNNKTKETMELSRLWTFLTLLPNLDQKVNTPQKLFSFPWDNEKKEVKKLMTENEFDDLMKQQQELLNKITNNTEIQ